MKLSELMKGRTPSPDYAGVATNDDFVLLMDVSKDGNAEEADYEEVGDGVSAVDASLESESDDKSYIRRGKVTVKTGTQRTFNVKGDRIHGDPFMDFALSHKVKFGTGQTVIRPYIYFSLLTGEGEKGKAAIIVNSDGSGEAGASAEIDIDVKATETPAEYTYKTP